MSRHDADKLPPLDMVLFAAVCIVLCVGSWLYYLVGGIWRAFT
jgi:hypothetical protein